MDISSAYSANQTASVFATSSRQSRGSRSEAQRGQGDSVSISDEAYAALEASRRQVASKDAQRTASAAFPPLAELDTKTAQVVRDDSLPDAATSSASSSGLMDELRAYLANPILQHALDQMDDAIQRMGLSPEAKEAVRKEVMAVFRSGIPAEGEQTSDAMNALRKNLKENVGLEEDVLGDLMGEISAIVEDAQKKEERLGKGDKDGERDVNATRS